MVKNQAKAKQHPEVEFSLFERCYPKIIEHILKYLQINKCNCFNEITWFIIMKIKLKMKNKSHRYDKNRSRHWQGHKYAKYKVSPYASPYMYQSTPKQHF